MPRTTLEHHADWRDAASATASLREVGLKAGDIGSIWLKPEHEDPIPATVDAQIPLYEATIDGLGVLQFSGWLADAALSAFNETGRMDLVSIMDDADVDADGIERVRSVIAAGGGITGVRARDAHLQDDD